MNFTAVAARAHVEKLIGKTSEKDAPAIAAAKWGEIKGLAEAFQMANIFSNLAAQRYLRLAEKNLTLLSDAAKTDQALQKRRGL